MFHVQQNPRAPHERLRERLTKARDHLAATNEGPGRIALAYWQLVHALDELGAVVSDASEAEQLAAAELASIARRADVSRAVGRTAQRMRSIGLEP
jgi:hypothetical protein